MKWNFGMFCPSAIPTGIATIESDRIRWSTVYHLVLRNSLASFFPCPLHRCTRDAGIRQATCAVSSIALTVSYYQIHYRMQWNLYMCHKIVLKNERTKFYISDSELFECFMRSSHTYLVSSTVFSDNENYIWDPSCRSKILDCSLNTVAEFVCLAEANCIRALRMVRDEWTNQSSVNWHN